MLIHSANELAIFIKNQRKKLKLSQKAVGDLVGLKQKTISAIENNPENVKLNTVFRILSALETAVLVSPKTPTSNTKWNEEW